MKKILIFTRCSWTLINFRYDYIKFIINKNFNVTVACDFKNSELLKLKKLFPLVKFVKINFLNESKSLFNEFKICYQIIRLFLKSKFNIIHNFTIRPVIYSTLIGKLLTTSNIINSITGLGHVFNNKKSFFFKLLINTVYISSNYIIFQNKDDFFDSSYKFLRNKISYTIIFPTIKEKIKMQILKKRKPKNIIKKKIIFLMFCRLIEQKGVREFLNAAKYINEEKKKLNSEFRLFGNIDLNNPSSLRKSELNFWKKKKYIKILKHTDLIDQEIIKSDIICLPSYGEGMPASLLEALYFSKGIITTNVNGCKEVVKNNYNGYIVPKKNHLSLAKKFLDIINNPYLIKYFGKNSKKYFEKKFSKNPYDKMYKIINLM